MKENVLEVVNSIVGCPYLVSYFENGLDSGCRKIIESQGKKIDKDAFQMPEPFNGMIDKAKVLVIGANPSFSKGEAKSYPKYNDCKHDIARFFYHFFENSAIDGIRKKSKEGVASKNYVRYWANIKARVTEIIPNAKAGVDYCLTEAVHCKSVKSKGLKEASSNCQMHLKSILKVSEAKVLLIAGAEAKKALKTSYPHLPKVKDDKLFTAEIEGRERMVLLMPHPNAMKIDKKLDKILTKEQLKTLEDILR